MEQTVTYLLMVKKFINSKQKILRLQGLHYVCLGNILKDWSVDNMKKKTGLNGYAYDFSVDYDAIEVDDILDIHNYVMKKNDIV